MYNQYCKDCGRPSNGYQRCKSCYYKQQINENEYEEVSYNGSSNVINDIATIVGGIATIVQCFSSNKNKAQEQPQKQNTIELQKEINQIEFTNKRYKTSKGFYVKSQYERSISDFLTENGIFHIYEKRFYIGEGKYIFPDFYIKGPVLFNGRVLREVYIEHWGVENSGSYDRKKDEVKIPAYRQAGITLINTYPDDMEDYRNSLTYKLTHYKENEINY